MIASNNEDPRFTAEAMCMDITVFVETFLYFRETRTHACLYFTRGVGHRKIRAKIQNTGFFFPQLQRFNKSEIKM